MAADADPRRSSNPSLLRPSYQVDNSRWPLSIHRSPAVIQPLHIAEMFRQIDESFRRNETHALILDFDDEIEVSAANRRTLANELRARNVSFARYCRAIAVLARTSHARGVHTALRWLAPATCPERAFESQAEAEEWAKRQLLSPERIE